MGNDLAQLQLALQKTITDFVGGVRQKPAPRGGAAVAGGVGPARSGPPLGGTAAGVSRSVHDVAGSPVSGNSSAAMLAQPFGRPGGAG